MRRARLTLALCLLPLACTPLASGVIIPWSDIGGTPTTLAGYGISDAQPLDSDLTSIAALTTTAFGRGLLELADAAAARTTLGVAIGTDVQAYDADLASLAAAAATDALYYRSAADTWSPVTIGSGLSFSAGTLSTSGGSGTVTSVGLSLPAIFTVSGSPITTSGTLTGSLASQSANMVFAGPASGAAAAPTFRSLVAADIPDLSGTYQPLDGDLTSLAAASATGSLYYRSAADTWSTVTIGSGLSFSAGTLSASGGSGDVTAASAFGADNVLIRSDGTGKGVQSSAITLDDSDNLSGITSLQVTPLASPPAKPLTVVDGYAVDSANETAWGAFTFGTGAKAGFYAGVAGGSSSTPSATTSGSTLASFAGHGHRGSGWNSTPSASMNIEAAEAFGTSAWGGRVVWRTITTGSTTLSERMRLDPDGNLLVGTTSTTGLTGGGNLRVNAEVMASSLTVGSLGAEATGIFSNSGSLDWPSISAGSESTRTLTVSGVSTTGTPSVSLGWSAALETGVVVKQAWVSAANTVSITLLNTTASAVDPAAVTVRATVTRF